MKTLCLTILSFLFVVAVRGQSPGSPTQINNTRYYSFKQFLGSDSAYLMAQRDTNWLPSRPAMIFRPGDSTVYYWNLRYWIAFAKAVGPTNLGIYLLKANFIDSLNNNRQQLSKLGDTVYLSFGGKVNVMPDTTTKVATINFVKNQGYIKTETDPVFSGSAAFGITTININNWNSAFNNATFDSVGKKLRLFAINGAQDSLVINSVLATNFNPVSHDSTIIMQGTGKVYGDTLRVMVDTTRSGIATHNWTLGQGFIKSETDPVATAKTITMVNGSGVTIFGSPTQTLGSNPTWTFKADTGLVATLAALGDSVVNKKHWDSAFVKVRFDTSSRVLTMYDFKNDSAIVVIPKGGTQNGMVAINTIRYGDILKIYADNGASTEITINNQDSLTRAHFGDTTTYFYPLKSNPAKYISLTALSALVPLSYVNTTGVFSLDTSGAANGVATINYVNRQGYVKTETDPVATAKTVTVTAGIGITVTGAAQTVGSNPAFTVAAQNTTAIWNANQLQGTPVSTTPPSTNQLLQYNGTNWIGFTPTYAPGFTTTVPITYSSNVIGLDTASAAHGMASINYVQRQGYLTANQSITVTASGDATGTGSGNTAITLPLTLANSGVTAGGFTRGIVNAKGLITSATDTAYLPVSGGTLTGALAGTAATFSTSITDGALLSAPFVATNSSGTFIPAAYTPYNPASYPVNAGGETLTSVTTRGNQSSNFIRITGSSGALGSGGGLEFQYAFSTGEILTYDRTLSTYLPTQITGGTTPTNKNTLFIDNTGFSFKDKNGVTQASIDSIGQVHANKFITSGGLSSQFVKGDGSLDGTAYAPATLGTGYIQNGTSQQASANFNIAGFGQIRDSLFVGSPIYKGNMFKVSNDTFHTFMIGNQMPQIPSAPYYNYFGTAISNDHGLLITADTNTSKYGYGAQGMLIINGRAWNQDPVNHYGRVAEIGMRAGDSIGDREMEMTVGYDMGEVTTDNGYSITRWYGTNSSQGASQMIQLLGDSTAFTYGFRNYTAGMMWNPYRTDNNFLHLITGNILLDAGNVNTQGLATNIRVITANYSVVLTDRTIVNNAAGAITLTLLTAAAAHNQELILSNHTASVETLSIAVNLIAGGTTTTMAAHSSMHIQSDGTNWWQIN